MHTRLTKENQAIALRLLAIRTLRALGDYPAIVETLMADTQALLSAAPVQNDGVKRVAGGIYNQDGTFAFHNEPVQWHKLDQKFTFAPWTVAPRTQWTTPDIFWWMRDIHSPTYAYLRARIKGISGRKTALEIKAEKLVLGFFDPGASIHKEFYVYFLELSFQFQTRFYTLNPFDKPSDNRDERRIFLFKPELLDKLAAIPEPLTRQSHLRSVALYQTTPYIQWGNTARKLVEAGIARGDVDTFSMTQIFNNPAILEVYKEAGYPSSPQITKAIIRAIQALDQQLRDHPAFEAAYRPYWNHVGITGLAEFTRAL